MPEAISNTSPLLYLHQIGVLHWLPKLFDKIWVPGAVDPPAFESALQLRGTPLNLLLPLRVGAVSPGHHNPLSTPFPGAPSAVVSDLSLLAL